MRQAGVTMVLVSHDLDLVESFADRAVYLSAGRIRAEGEIGAVIERYRADVVGGPETRDDGEAREDASDLNPRRWGNGAVEIVSVELVGASGSTRLMPNREACSLVIRYLAHEKLADFVFGVAWHAVDGTLVAGHNTHLDRLDPQLLDGEGEVRCEYPSLDLAAGTYRVDVAVHARGGTAYDYWCDALQVQVTSEVEWPGTWAPEHRWSWNGTTFK
jgi:hypothetical protein